MFVEGEITAKLMERLETFLFGMTLFSLYFGSILIILNFHFLVTSIQFDIETTDCTPVSIGWI